MILTWADAHHARTGAWPTARTGPIVEAPGETWMSVDKALSKGFRGLPGRQSLAQLLRQERSVPERRGRRAPQPDWRRRAAELRAQGLAPKEIARQLEVSAAAVYELLQRLADQAGPEERG
jgi:hypothetical protein